MAYKQQIGQAGEELAADHVGQLGMRICDRNWRIKEGEIDLIAQEPDGTFVFIEVKARSSLNYGHPLEAITSAKALRLQRLALAWLVTHGSWGSGYRIDCCAIVKSATGAWEIDYRRGVL
jgi:putative endonuclease